MLISGCICAAVLVCWPVGAQQKPSESAQPPVDALGQTAILTPGHSAHGEAFNEGPRQRAYLMKGIFRVHFPVTTKSSLAQKYFEQGVVQLHGFWYFEAERS